MVMGFRKSTKRSKIRSLSPSISLTPTHHHRPQSCRISHVQEEVLIVSKLVVLVLNRPQSSRSLFLFPSETEEFREKTSEILALKRIKAMNKYSKS